MNVGKTEVIRMTKQPSPIQITIEYKHPENVEYFNYLDRITTNDARCTREMKFRIAVARASFNKKNLFFFATV